MVNRLEERENYFGQHIDVDKLETLICIEALVDSCYQSLAGLVHNQTIRKECQQLEQRVQHHQEELKRIFPLSQKSEDAIKDKIYKHLLQLKPPGFSTRIVVAATAEIHGDHLILLNSRGQLAALFVLEMVESWNRL